MRRSGNRRKEIRNGFTRNWAPALRNRGQYFLRGQNFDATWTGGLVMMIPNGVTGTLTDPPYILQ
jgi:hypothetical protein